ncbi:glycosyl transferase [Clostridium acetobutylicum]|nr:glycosyl transferase [Clostridium acetobutylicum]
MKLNLEREKKILLKNRNRYRYFHKPGVSIIVCTNKIKYIENIFSNYSRINYPIKEMIIILNKMNLNISKYKKVAERFSNVRIIKKPENVTLGKCLNYGVDISKYNYIFKMDDDDYYGENYIYDEITSLIYTNSDIVGKASFFVYYEGYGRLEIMYPEGNEKYIPNVAGSTLLIKKSVFNKVRFRNISLAEDACFIEDCCKQGIKIYSCNRFNYVYFKHRSLNDHTWKISSEDLMKVTKKVGKYKNYLPIVTV